MSAARSAAHDMRLKITAVSSWALIQTLGPFLLLAAIAIWAAIHFASAAPPRRLTLSSGPKGSIFEANAQKYSKILARSGIKLNVIESAGSSDNLNRLSDPKSHVDIAFVQSGLAQNEDTGDLVSLGGVFFQPMLIFYRSPKPLIVPSSYSSRYSWWSFPGCGSCRSCTAGASIPASIAATVSSWRSNESLWGR